MYFHKNSLEGHRDALKCVLKQRPAVPFDKRQRPGVPFDEAQGLCISMKIILRDTGTH